MFNNLVWLLKVVKVVEVDAVEDVKEEDDHNDDAVDVDSDADEDDALQGSVCNISYFQGLNKDEEMDTNTIITRNGRSKFFSSCFFLLPSLPYTF
nr:hypothetical protein [Tanacetum cinerariifolium]